MTRSDLLASLVLRLPACDELELRRIDQLVSAMERVRVDVDLAIPVESNDSAHARDSVEGTTCGSSQINRSHEHLFETAGAEPAGRLTRSVRQTASVADNQGRYLTPCHFVERTPIDYTPSPGLVVEVSDVFDPPTIRIPPKTVLVDFDALEGEVDQ